jgi:phosphonate metabolism protein (transferase hexapeptide repeat family)
MLHSVDLFPAERAHQAKKLGVAPTIHPTCVIYKSRIGAWTDIGPNCTIAESTFDDYSYAAGDVSIIYAQVGKFCSIASHVRINPGNHPMDRVMQHHLTYRRVEYGFGCAYDEAFFDWRRAHQCVIGHDVWLGHAAVVMPGVSIGTGAVVGSQSVVTRDVAPYEVVGVPARPIRRRFAPEVIEKLLAIAWWDWDRTLLEARFNDFLDLPAFLEKYAN